MIKKIITLLFISFFLFSCSDKQEEKKENNNEFSNECLKPYNIGGGIIKDLSLKGLVISDEIKNVSSPSAGIISYLNCESGRKVYKTTLIAKVVPDYNNPNIANLNIQKSSLLNQKLNLENLKINTINNFDKQIESLKEQILLLEKNIELTKKSGNLSKKDLQKQIKTLEDSLKSLEKNLKLLYSAKKEALEKIEISKRNTYKNIKNIISDNLLKIDEIFGVTEENKELNDRYDDYLGMKNSLLLAKVKEDFLKMNNKNKKIDELTEDKLTEFLEEMIKLDEEAQESVKSSIDNVYFPKTQIDTFYTIFFNYSKNLIDLKNAWENLKNSKKSTITNFDTQISALESQITSTKNNLENLKTNKIGNVDTSVELQLSKLEGELKNLKTNLSNLKSNKKSQVISIDNQIIQLTQAIKSINSSLSPRSIYSGVDGIVKQKMASKGNNIGMGLPICQIIPIKKSTKIKIFSPIELKIGDKLNFMFDGNKYVIFVENALVYKDSMTQNYIYESNYLDKKLFKDGEILELKLEKNNNEDIKDKINKNLSKTLNKIPLSYVINKIDGNYLKVKTNTGVINKKVTLGDIDGSFVEVKNGLNSNFTLCK